MKRVHIRSYLVVSGLVAITFALFMARQREEVNRRMRAKLALDAEFHTRFAENANELAACLMRCVSLHRRDMVYGVKTTVEHARELQAFHMQLSRKCAIASSHLGGYLSADPPGPLEPSSLFPSPFSPPFFLKNRSAPSESVPPPTSREYSGGLVGASNEGSDDGSSEYAEFVSECCQLLFNFNILMHEDYRDYLTSSQSNNLKLIADCTVSRIESFLDQFEQSANDYNRLAFEWANEAAIRKVMNK